MLNSRNFRSAANSLAFGYYMGILKKKNKTKKKTKTKKKKQEQKQILHGQAFLLLYPPYSRVDTDVLMEVAYSCNFLAVCPDIGTS